jgi:hypothetical protein
MKNIYRYHTVLKNTGHRYIITRNSSPGVSAEVYNSG